MVFRFKLVCWLALTMFLVSCTKSGEAPPDLPAGELALLRWQALIEGDFAKAYEFETPAYRSTYTADLYTYNFNGGIDWQEIELRESKEITENLIKVSMTLTYLYNEGSDFEQLVPSNITESWILVDGHWWHVPEE